MTGTIIDILLVDDSPSVIEMFVRNGHHWRLAVTAAPDGVTGLLHARQKAFDGIILDLQLPDTPGLRLLQQLRTEGNWTPVVILTGYPSTASILEAGRWGVIDYFVKPASTARIAHTLRRAACLPSVPAPAALHPMSVDSAIPVWVRAKTVLSRWAAASAAHGPNIDACRRDLLDLVIDASVDAKGTALPQFALLSRIVREGLHVEGIAQAIRRGLTILAEAEALNVERTIPAYAKYLHPFETPHQLKEDLLAAELRVDTTTVGRQLKRLFGCGFRDLRWAALIRPAVAPIARGSEPIGNVAIDCGYAAPHWAQFDRDFRHLLGESPSHFRKRMAGRHS